MEALTTTLREIWDSFFGKVIILAISLGWMPFYLLSKAHAALQG